MIIVLRSFQRVNVSYRMYGEEGAGTAGTTGQGAATGTAGTTGQGVATGTTGVATPAVPLQEKMLPESKVNEIVQGRIAEYAEKARRAQALVDELSKQQTATAEEKTNFANKISELQSTLRSKEEQAEHERKKAAADSEAAATALKTERDQWQNRYTQTVINNELIKAASDNKAYNSQQIVDLLHNKAKLIETIDGAGNPTGQLEVKIAWKDLDKEGKEVDMLLSPQETVKAMKQKETFANLFLAVGGGTGYVPTRGDQITGAVDPDKMSAADYIGGGRARIHKTA